VASSNGGTIVGAGQSAILVQETVGRLLAPARSAPSGPRWTALALGSRDIPARWWSAFSPVCW